MNYEVRGWMKEATPDDWNDGMDDKNSVHFSGHDHFRAPTLELLIKQLNQFFWCDYVMMGMNEQGDQLVLERYEDGNGDRVDTKGPMMEEWKAGKVKLWVARYYFLVEEVDRRPAKLEEKEYEL